MGNLDDQSDWPVVEPLTRREREILALLAEGFSAPEIAEQLTLAVSSVKWHIQQLYGKLGVNTKRKALVRAAGLGLLAPSGGTAIPAPSAAPGTHSPSDLSSRATRPRRRLGEVRLSTGLRHNLPLQLTNFIGRAEQIADVTRLLRGNRLLTLVGPGGTGKTRLALQAAAEMLPVFPDGAWLVELASIGEPALVPQAVAQALMLHSETAGSVEAAPADYSSGEVMALVGDHLRRRILLLILDNCEHLISACAQLAEQLLRTAPGLRLLATSREALGVTGEHSYLLPALSVPGPGNPPALEILTESESARLFVERAAAVRPDFTLTRANAAAVAEICRRLEGMPLAIELAAARARALSVEQIAAHLAEHHRLRLLTGGSRTAPPRQQTLRGTIDWSYELLTDGERALLRRLSVFAGGWTLEAAEQLMNAPDTLDWLTQLVGKSLVLSNQQTGQATRFSMLETIREYAQERLVEVGETELAHARHLAFYVSLAEQADLKLRGRGQPQWLKHLDLENDNLRAALAWAVKSEDMESAQRLAGALTYFWAIRGYGAEGCGWLEAALDLPTSPDMPKLSLWQAKALMGAGWLDREKDLTISRSRLERAFNIYQGLGDQAGMAQGLLWLGRHRLYMDPADTAATEMYQQALDLWTAAEDGWGIGICLHWMAHEAEAKGDNVRARGLYQQSVELLREAGDAWQMIGPQNDLFLYSWADGDAARARAVIEENLALHEELGFEQAVISSLHQLYWNSVWQGHYARAAECAHSILKTTTEPFEVGAARGLLGHLNYQQGQLPEARAHLEAALAIFREINAPFMLGWLLPWLGCVAYRAGDLDQAGTLMEQGRALLLPGQRGELTATLLNLGDVTRTQGESTVAAEHYALGLKLAVQFSDLPNVVLLLDAFAKLSALADAPQRAARLFGAAQALRQRIGTPIPAVEQGDYDRGLEQVRAQVDPDAFSRAWAEGQALSWEQAAAHALEAAPAEVKGRPVNPTVHHSMTAGG